jgi:hypothetical protein
VEKSPMHLKTDPEAGRLDDEPSEAKHRHNQVGCLVWAPLESGVSSGCGNGL